MILILFSLHPFYFHPLVFRKVVCKCDKLKKMFLHKVSCGQHRSLHNPRPRVWDGKEKRRPSSSIFSLLYPESRETSGQCGHSLETGDLQTRKLIEYFVVRHHKPRHSPQPFIKIRLSSTFHSLC